MTQTHTFSAQPRQVLGKKVKTLRKNGLVPANIIGHSVDPLAIMVAAGGFRKLYQEVGDTGLIYLEIEGESKARPVLVEEVTVDPLREDLIHVVFKQVNLKEKIMAEVPIELEGEVDVAGGVMLQVVNSVEVEALPTDFPDHFTLNVAGLTEIGQSLSFSDLQYDTAKLKLQLEEEELTNPIVLIQEVKEEVEPEVVEEVTEATPAEGEVVPTPETTAEAASE